MIDTSRDLGILYYKVSEVVADDPLGVPSSPPPDTDDPFGVSSSPSD